MKTFHWTVCVLALATACGGCVPPGEIDATAINRYQAAMARKGPQARLGKTGLDEIKPIPGTTGPELKMTQGPGGKPQVRLTLEQAVMRALANNMDIRVTSYDPAVAREEMVKAAAAFDYIVFGGYQYQKQDMPQAVSFLGTENKISTFNAGLRNHTVTGADWQLAWTMTRTWTNTSLVTVNPSYQPTLVFQGVQPLLRNAWPDVNLAQLNIARVNRKISEQAFRQQVEQTITDVVTAYWGLALARRNQEIADQLLQRTIETQDRVKARATLDATAVEIKQAEASVEVRRALLIQANSQVIGARDLLVKLLADQQINLANDVDVIPITPLNREPVILDETDQLVTALAFNAQLEQARLAIQVADINVRVAKNQTLPRLDLSGSAGYAGLGQTLDAGNDNFWTGDFLSYSIGLNAEYPLGNRAAIAQLHETQFQRLKSIATWQNTADTVAEAVNQRVRLIRTSYQTMQAQHSAVEASIVQLQALEDTERIRGRLTPEFLQLKLQAQGSLAEAQQAEMQAMVQYNNSMADLARVTGTILQLQQVKLAMPVAMGESAWPITPDEVPPPATSPASRKSD